MNITIKRFAFKDEYTIGRLSIDGKYICDTLEPYSVHVSGKDNTVQIQEQKFAYGTIAIPTGSYKVQLSMSSRFHKKMPYLMNVKGFEGVMLHPGNYPKDTRGCILPGWNRRVGMVCASVTAFSEIMSHINMALSKGEEVKVTIKEH